MVVVGLLGVVMVALPGPESGAQVPPPDPDIVAVPPGSTAQVTVLSGPAFGLVTMTVSAAVAVQVPKV